jgi:1-deoxy-D-xylulose-5-phosphate synthase
VGYLRVFPNMTVMAAGDAFDLPAMLEFSLRQDSPCAIRYPKAATETIDGDRQPVRMGRSEVLRWGSDGMIFCFGTLLGQCVSAARKLQAAGLDVGVVNARFAKPLDREVLERALQECRWLVTVEEAALAGGFGSAVLELTNDLGPTACAVRRLGLPDHWIEHGERSELLAELGLDSDGIARACLEMSGRQPAIEAGQGAPRAAPVGHPTS